MSIHSEIKRLREAKGWSQQRLADEVAAREGVAKLAWQTVQQWEKEGGTAPKRKRLEHVAAALDTSVNALLGSDAEDQPTRVPGFNALHELQLQILEDMEDLLPEDAAEFRAQIHARAEAMRRHKAFLLAKTNSNGVAPHHKVAHIPAAPDITPAPKPGYSGAERRHRDMPVLLDRRHGGLPEEYLGAKPPAPVKGKTK